MKVVYILEVEYPIHLEKTIVKEKEDQLKELIASVSPSIEWISSTIRSNCNKQFPELPRDGMVGHVRLRCKEGGMKIVRPIEKKIGGSMGNKVSLPSPPPFKLTRLYQENKRSQPIILLKKNEAKEYIQKEEEAHPHGPRDHSEASGGVAGKPR